MIDYFDQKLGLNEQTGLAVANAVAQVYAMTDTAFATPLPITDMAGLPMSELRASPNGIYPVFRCAGHTQVNARSGGVTTPITSLLGHILMLIPSPAGADDGLTLATVGGEYVLVPGGAGSGDASDDGIASLVDDQDSATRAALASVYGPGFVVLDLDDPVPPGTPAGTIIIRVGTGTPPTVTVYAEDDFNRTTAAGWGSALMGGAWDLSHPARFSTVTTDAGKGIISVEATAAHRQAGLPSVVELNSEVLVTVSRDDLGVGGLIAQAVLRSSAGGTTFYAASLRIYASNHPTTPGRVDLALGLSGFNTLVDYSLGVLTGYTQGRKINVRLRTEGSAPTVVSTRCWYADQPEPTGWQKTASDSSAATQVAGRPKLVGYLTSSETTLPQRIAVHDFKMTGL